MSASEPRLYVYKLTTDNGCAPCVKNDLLSLAICKPRIRRTAKKGDWIFGFGGKDKPMSNRLIYIAEITEEPLKNGEYYRNPEFRRIRLDCIYEWLKDGIPKLDPKAKCHNTEDHSSTDIGTPPGYNKARVLLSRNFRYFGIQGTTEYKKKYPLIARLVESRLRDYQVNYTINYETKLSDLRRETWREFNISLIGRPTEALKIRCAKA